MVRTRRSRTSAARSFTVAVTGDWAPIRAYEPAAREHPLGLYGDLLPALRAADLRIVNCEAALTRLDRPVCKSGAVFKGEPAHACGLAAVPFDVACLANNHVLDYGTRGLAETIRSLDRMGIRTVGAGLTPAQAYAPLTLDAEGHRVHIVNVSEGEDETGARRGAGVFGWDIQRAVQTVEACRDDGGLVIVIVHAGLEYVPFAPPYIVEAYRALADAGAAAVIGHHPHVPQGAEWRNGAPIFYSLGNFVFYQPTSLIYRKIGFFVVLTSDGTRVTRADLHPYVITDNGVRAMQDRERAGFGLLMTRLSRPYVSPTGHLAAWDAYLDYYGAAGFDAEVTGILARMKEEPGKGAAMFRNRVTTPQHAELWKTFLTRMIDGRAGKGPKAARALVADYFTRTI